MRAGGGRPGRSVLSYYIEQRVIWRSPLSAIEEKLSLLRQCVHSGLSLRMHLSPQLRI